MRLQPILFSGLLCISILFSNSCSRNYEDPSPEDYRAQMRDFVIRISRYCRDIQPGFLVFPQNGIDLITSNGESTGDLSAAYIEAIDGAGQEELFYGYDNQDNIPTPSDVTSHLSTMLGILKNQGKTLLVTDYCSDLLYLQNAYQENKDLGFVPFVATHRELDNIPGVPQPVWLENSEKDTTIKQVKNFLYLINTQMFPTKAGFISAVCSSNYDLLIMDLFAQDGTQYSRAEVEQLRRKSNGGKRLILCYVSIGEAEDYRYYWQSGWDQQKPEWLGNENPDWKGNFSVKFWYPAWQNLIFGNDGSYMKKVLDSGFDGVYLDRVDAFEDFE